VAQHGCGQRLDLAESVPVTVPDVVEQGKRSAPGPDFISRSVLTTLRGFEHHSSNARTDISNHGIILLGYQLSQSARRRQLALMPQAVVVRFRSQNLLLSAGQEVAVNP
jgi:hypothetical protein